MQTRGPSLALTVSSVMSSRCAAEDGGGRGRRRSSLSEGTLSALMEWLAGPPWGAKVKGGGRGESERSAHLESLGVSRALAVKGETGRLAGGEGGSDTGHTTVRDQ